ncbi:MAG: tRNA (adenosine(37)-N6)-threonylcarbamoyltransferase complex dimerization subunit type 1 TsaB [Myxococcales bacterium]|nr:tRNA (adenosine(37)-N6)-threonylcarbamoyltransferase complex dimerization subunit type 1 TsaB [Myxococcales bacterium]
MGPWLLAVESATAIVSVALMRGGDCVASRRGDPARPAAETLLPSIQALLEEAEVRVADLDAYAVSIGPGSFTSLRIGLATVKGLAFGSDRPAVAVPTLAVLAASAPPGEGLPVPMLDARRGEVYAAAYAADASTPDPRLPLGVYGPEALEAALPPQCRLLGEGAAVCGAALREALGEGVTLLPELAPRAECLGALGMAALERGQGTDPALLAPWYLRRAQAEVLRTGEAWEAPPANAPQARR